MTRRLAASMTGVARPTTRIAWRRCNGPRKLEEVQRAEEVKAPRLRGL
jgi:hypothetical protein